MLYNRDMDMATEDFDDTDHDENHECLNCRADRMEFRLVRGTSYEGLSIREIYYDENNNMIGYGSIPLSPPTDTKQATIQELIEMFKSIDDMLTAAKRPILDEGKLEATFRT